MTFAREKRLLLGWLAALAPLPLPFNDVVSWFVLALYWVAVALFLRRAAQDAGGWLPNWALNLLALAYAPLFLVDLSSLWRGRMLQPVVHLLLFALVVKLFALQREKDKWHVALVIFFLFLAAAGTSVHPSVLLYIIAFAAGGMLTLSRFAAWEMVTRHPRTTSAVGIRLRGFVTGGVLFAIVTAIPLFVLMPRLRSPYVVGPGGGYGSLTQVAGFQEVMRLDGIGRARGSRSVVMRLTYESEPPPGHEARIKVMTYNRFSDDEWSRGDPEATGWQQRVLRRRRDGSFALGEEEVHSWMGVWMEPFGGRLMGVPVDAVRIDWVPNAAEGFVLGRNSSLLIQAGTVAFPLRRPGMVRYRVGLAEGRGREVGVPSGDPASALDGDGVAPGVTELAGRVVGEGSAFERARRVERHLIDNYSYTLDFLGAPQGRRIERFLLEEKRGHCELFATSMVLMLRSQGIPARLATGFLGADYNPIEGYYIVRESNAHAWVEAYIEGRGWMIFDPTPPAGRPAPEEIGLSQLAAQLYDYVVFRWDRYVLTYGLADQVGVVAGLRDLWLTVRGWFGDGASDGSRPRPAAVPAATDPAEPEVEGARPPVWPLIALLTVAIAGFLLMRRPRFTATRAYLRLRERLRPELGEALDAMAPWSVVRRLEDRYPASAEPARELVALYLDESFAGRALSAGELDRARQLLRLALPRRAA